MRFLRPGTSLAIALFGWLVGCGGGSGAPGTPSKDSGVMGHGGPDGGEVDDGAAEAEPDGGAEAGDRDSGGDTGSFLTAAHGAEPQVVTSGGSVLAAPKVQLIVYATDAVATDVESMVTELTMTNTWSEQTSQYGVGPFTLLPTIQIAGTPPATLDDNGNPSPFEQNLATQLSGANPAWGAADPSTIYMFLLPVGTNITSSGNCCSDFLGYHYEAPVGSGSVSYAIVCDCAPFSGDPLTPLQEVTTTVSHELVEAATDPFVASNPAYSQSDTADFVWTVETGGEIADMCNYNLDANYTPPGSTYMIQRSWSDSAATAGTNPCVPVPTSGPYFNSVPVLPDTLSFDYYGQTISTTGVQIPVGQSKTIDIQLFSSAPTSGPWTVTAYDLNAFLGGPANNTLSLSTSTGSNGDILKLTILATSAATNGGGFVLASDLGGQENLSMGMVGN